MRIAGRGGVAVAAAFASAAAVLGVGQARPTTHVVAVRVDLSYTGESPAWRGTFVSRLASGKVIDRGTAVDQPRQKLGVNWAIARKLAGKRGTLRFSILGPYRKRAATLRWTLLRGTGAYAGLRGSGRDVEHVEGSRAEAVMSGVPAP